MLIFARLLTPTDFGLIAVGAVFATAGRALSDAGLGPALIRRREPPLPDELGSVLGCGFAIAAAIVLVAAGLALTMGRLGGICLVMALSVPFAVVRSPGVIRCERSLNYSPLVLAELGEVIAYNLWGLGAVLSGFGVWNRRQPSCKRWWVPDLLSSGPVGKRPYRASTGSFLGRFLDSACRFQAVPVVLLARDQGSLKRPWNASPCWYQHPRDLEPRLSHHAGSISDH